MKDENKKFGYRQPKSTTKRYAIDKKISKTRSDQCAHPFRKSKNDK